MVPRIDYRLRERFFGNRELKANEIYSEIWRRDSADANHQSWNIESAVSVRKRVTELVFPIEGKMKDETILLVSHGDPLQLLQTAFIGCDTTLYRSLPDWETAEIRDLQTIHGRPLKFSPGTIKEIDFQVQAERILPLWVG